MMAVSRSVARDVRQMIRFSLLMHETAVWCRISDVAKLEQVLCRPSHRNSATFPAIDFLFHDSGMICRLPATVGVLDAFRMPLDR